VARELGEEIAKAGYLCINGGGKNGCMGALNEGARANGGKVRSFIFIIARCKEFLAHPPFLLSLRPTPSWASTHPSPPSLPPHQKSQIKTVIHGKWIMDKMEFEDVDELVVAQGNNLQERKRLLWETCDCVVVLPGGTGTWDELMEVRK